MPRYLHVLFAAVIVPMLMTSPALADAGVPDPSRLKAHIAFLKDRNFNAITRTWWPSPPTAWAPAAPGWSAPTAYRLPRSEPCSPNWRKPAPGCAITAISTGRDCASPTTSCAPGRRGPGVSWRGITRQPPQTPRPALVRVNYGNSSPSRGTSPPLRLSRRLKAARSARDFRAEKQAAVFNTASFSATAVATN